MTYTSWEPRHRVTTVRPGKLDLFVVTLIEGRRAHIDAITDYERALARAESFRKLHPCQIKVLPMAGGEARNFLGIHLPEQAEPINVAEREMMVATLKDIARNSADPDARTDAFDLLTTMGIVS